MPRRVHIMRSMALPMALVGLAVLMPIGVDGHAALARQVVDQAVEQAQTISQQVRASARTFMGRSAAPQSAMFAAQVRYELPMATVDRMVGQLCVDVLPLPGFRSSAGAFLIDLPPPNHC